MAVPCFSCGAAETEGECLQPGELVLGLTGPQDLCNLRTMRREWTAGGEGVPQRETEPILRQQGVLRECMPRHSYYVGKKTDNLGGYHSFLIRSESDASPSLEKLPDDI